MCSCIWPPEYAECHCDPDFVEIVDDFTSLAETSNSRLVYREFTVEYGDLGWKRDVYSGKKGYANTLNRTVTIDRSFADYYGIHHRHVQKTIWHELGHLLLGRQHHPKEYDSAGFIQSFMQTETSWKEVPPIGSDKWFELQCEMFGIRHYRLGTVVEVD